MFASPNQSCNKDCSKIFCEGYDNKFFTERSSKIFKDLRCNSAQTLVHSDIDVAARFLDFFSLHKNVSTFENKITLQLCN